MSKTRPKADLQGASVQWQPIESIVVREGSNPRRTRHADADAELEASVKSAGILQPLLLRPVVRNGFVGDVLEVVCGHRRLDAARAAGMTHVPALVRRLTDEEAERAAVLENVVREDLDPFEEAEAIARLLEVPGENVETVAGATGLSRQYVARRRHLAELDPRWRKKDLPADWLVDVALLPREAQIKLLGVPRHLLADRESLRAEIADLTRTLSLAPWDVDDAELVPKAGPCSSCPRQTANELGLFDELLPAGAKSQASVCLDPGCWAAKAKAHAGKLLDALRTKHSDLVVVPRSRGGYRQLRRTIEVAGTDKHWESEFVRAKKGSSGSRPMVLVDENGRASPVRWVRPYNHGADRRALPAKKKQAELPPKERLKAMRRRLRARREARELELLVEAVEASKGTPADDALFAETAAWLTGRASGGSVKNAREAVWRQVLGRALPAVRSVRDVRAARRLATGVAGTERVKAAQRQAREEISPPKTMQALEREVLGSQGTRERRSKRRKKKRSKA